MDPPSSNPLLARHTSSSSELHVVLHPLVLLNVSDYITRHTLREQPGPVVGALVGRQAGQEVTIEHAFEAQTMPSPAGDGAFLVHEQRFTEMLERVKQVHKDRPVELVGWYTLMSPLGPSPVILPIHQQLLGLASEGAIILLGFHTPDLLGHSVGGKLPLTLYESFWESPDGSRQGNTAGDDDGDDDGEDKKMSGDEDGAAATPKAGLELRFTELPYTVETGEAEMIAMETVARGGGNAAATEPRKPAREKSGVVAVVEAASPTKRRIVAQQPSGSASSSRDQGSAAPSPTAPGEDHGSADDLLLSREEDEMVASLTARANAVRMMNARIQLVTAYLERLPAEYLSGETSAAAAAASGEVVMADGPLPGAATEPSPAILRQIQALVGRLDLLAPADKAEFDSEVLREENDVRAISVLNDLMQGIQEAWKVGRKFNVVDVARAQALNRPFDHRGPGGGGVSFGSLLT